MSTTNKTFKIGLCMAGAVSAGAYTAGVMDYLIEVLDEWQKRKDNNEPNTPSHNIEISVIGGASAGGMTGIIVASAIQDKIEPVRKIEGDIMATQPNNKFYHSWVDLINDEMLNVLLDTSDITKDGLQSVLNSDFIDKIADRAVNVSDEPSVLRKYFSENMKLFVTLSNLEGIDFKVPFKSNSNKSSQYTITSHSDYACFKFCNTANDYANDGWIPLNFKTKLNTDIAKNSAMATGAFPIGLKARKVSRSSEYMNDFDWFSNITRGVKKTFTEAHYNTVNVDGGMINNEPFEKVREVLIKECYNEHSKEIREDSQEIQDYNKFKSTVVMIDPFPSETSKFNNSTDLTTIIGNTLGALLGQARIKPSVLIDAIDSNKAGQYLIAPVRYEMKNGVEMSIEGKEAIACGSLDGFGGFISKEFRIHDYFLGRANCEKFLRDYFTVPADTTNEIFVNGYSGVLDKTKLVSRIDKGLQIIPIFSKREEKPYLPKFSNNKDWPSVASADINLYRKLIKARVEKVLFSIAEYSKIQRVLLWIGAKVVLNGKITDSIIAKIIKSLEGHKLIKNTNN